MIDNLVFVFVWMLFLPMFIWVLDFVATETVIFHGKIVTEESLGGSSFPLDHEVRTYSSTNRLCLALVEFLRMIVGGSCWSFVFVLG